MFFSASFTNFYKIFLGHFFFTCEHFCGRCAGGRELVGRPLEDLIKAYEHDAFPQLSEGQIGSLQLFVICFGRYVYRAPHSKPKKVL